MTEYIEREAVLKEVEPEYRPFLAQRINAIPAADVRPVKHARWIDMGDFILCSSCNATRLFELESHYGKAKRLGVRTNYCPNCGVDMRETEPQKNETCEEG